MFNNPEKYTRLGNERLVRGDIFSYENIVVPCKTAGRWYGAISQGAERLGVPFPSLSLCESKIVEHGAKKYLFVALWSDTSVNTSEHIFQCSCSALLASAHGRLDTLAMPLLGGKDGHKYIGDMERAIDYIEYAIEPTGMSLPEELVFVTL